MGLGACQAVHRDAALLDALPHLVLDPVHGETDGVGLGGHELVDRLKHNLRPGGGEGESVAG